MHSSYSILYTRITGESNILRIDQKIGVGVPLIWQKVIAVSEYNSFRSEISLFKFGELQIIRQNAELNTPPIILCVQ